jgi:hypothetical protein
MSTRPTFYVMEYIHGDECLIAHRPTLAAALYSLIEEHEHRPLAQLSIWRSDGRLLLPTVQAAKAALAVHETVRA